MRLNIAICKVVNIHVFVKKLPMRNCNLSVVTSLKIKQAAYFFTLVAVMERNKSIFCWYMYGALISHTLVIL